MSRTLTSSETIWGSLLGLSVIVAFGWYQLQPSSPPPSSRTTPATASASPKPASATRPEVTFDGTTARATKMVRIHYGSDRLGNEVMGLVYAAAQNPEVTQVVVKVIMSKKDIVNEYGHPIPADIQMGELATDDLTEVRKYASQEYYARNELVRLKMGIHLIGLQHFKLLD
jgi:hypothetical protein